MMESHWLTSHIEISETSQSDNNKMVSILSHLLVISLHDMLASAALWATDKVCGDRL